MSILVKAPICTPARGVIKAARANVLETDSFQADWLASLFGSDIAYDSDTEEWHRYNPATGLWPLDKQAASIRNAVREAAVPLAVEPSGPNGRKVSLGDRQDSAAYRAMLDNRPVLSAMESLSLRPQYRTDTDAWDQDRHLIGCANGVLDLRQGRLLSAGEARPHKVTMSTGLNFKPNLVPQRFLAHMRLVQPDPVMRAYLLRTFGYMLTGETGEQLWWFWYGPTASNGKSQTADIIRLVLGEYGKIVQPALFVREQFKNAINVGSSIHDIRRARMGDLAELSHVAELDSETLKRLVDGVAQGFTYRKPYGHGEMTAHPPVKFIGHGNSRPTVTDGGNGFWRRTVVIGWDQVVPEKDRIKDYGAVLVAEEGEAILSYLAREAQAYYAEGLAPEPGAIAAATAEYRASADHFASWVNDAVLATGKRDDSVTAGELFRAYERWCNEQNIRDAQRVSGQDFKERFLQSTTPQGVYWRRTKAASTFFGLQISG